MPLLFCLLGALSLAASVSLSAYGTHGLYEAGAAAEVVRAWDWAVQLQATHSLGLIVLGVMMRVKERRTVDPSLLYRIAGWLVIASMAMFSFTIYLDTLGWVDLTVLTPWGGTLFPIAWLIAAIGMWREFRA